MLTLEKDPLLDEVRIKLYRVIEIMEAYGSMDLVKSLCLSFTGSTHPTALADVPKFIIWAISSSVPAAYKEKLRRNNMPFVITIFQNSKEIEFMDIIATLERALMELPEIIERERRKALS